MPHLLYLAIGFPPAAKSCTFRMRATANLFCSLGWDVTVLTLPVHAWELEFGVDWTLMGDVDPRVRVVEMPLMREDLDPQVRHYSWLRARYPVHWRTWRRRLDMVRFPEPVFGPWRDTIVRSALAVHSERPTDLALITPAPYTTLAAAGPLHERGVPFVVDYRDGWSVDVVNGVEAFGRRSRRGRIEQRLMSDATRVWCVNEPITDFYRQRYPATADRIRVVRNGFDASDHLSHPPRPRDHSEPLHFGYLGTINFPREQTTAMLAGWRAARDREPLLDGAHFTIRGHIGAGPAKGATSHALRIARHHADGVSYGGPVVKAEVHDVYAGWDALVLCLAGGRYVTSGKVYEYMATGLPIVSIHEPDHAAADLLRGYPLHVATRSLSESDITDAFVRAAGLAATATPEQRLEARAFAARYERVGQLKPGVLELHGLLCGEAPDHAREEGGGHGPPRRRRDVGIVTCVLLIAGADPSRAALASARQQLPPGTTIDLALIRKRRNIAGGLNFRSARVMRRPAARLRSRVPGGLVSPGWWGDLAIAVRGKLLDRSVDAQAKTWYVVTHDPWVRARIAEADVIVALDSYAIYAVWRIARRLPGTDAVFGLDAAVRAVLAREGQDTTARPETAAANFP